MKTWMYALMGLAPNLLAWNALAGPPGECEKVAVQRTADPNGAAATGDGNQFVWVTADGNQIEAEVDAEVLVVGDAGAPDGRSDSKVKKIKVVTTPKSDDPEAAQRGWLGVSILHVPEAMSAQLGTQGRGVMVGNVVTDSPADKAGIEADDIIVSINGQNVAADVGPAVDLIKSRKPGESINIGLLRDGKPMTVSATLGSRADMKNFDWKFEGMPAEIQEQIRTRGKFMVRGPEGELIVKDLGEIDDLKNLPHNIRMFVPQAGSRSTQVTVENGQKTIKMNVEKDGSTISIEQQDGGPITVRRTDDDGNETVATYDDEDALKAADDDAYDLYSQAGQAVVVHVDGGDDHLKHFYFHGGDADAGQWRIHLEESLAQAKEAYGAAMEELHKNLTEMKNEGTFDVNKLHEMLDASGAKGFGQGFTFYSGKPKHRFDVNADGSISVAIRKGDSEMVQSFRNESDLAKRRPDLYEKYEAVKAADQD